MLLALHKRMGVSRRNDVLGTSIVWCLLSPCTAGAMSLEVAGSARTSAGAAAAAGDRGGTAKASPWTSKSPT